MSRRSQGREYALQILYQMDVGSDGLQVDQLDAALEEYWRNFTFKDEVRQFAEDLVRGTVDHLDDIHATLHQASSKWKVSRMSPVDRNILRLGIYELTATDTPPPVIINEAIELAKRFGAEQTPAFVNGLLDEIRRRRDG